MEAYSYIKDFEVNLDGIGDIRENLNYIIQDINNLNKRFLKRRKCIESFRPNEFIEINEKTLDIYILLDERIENFNEIVKEFNKITKEFNELTEDFDDYNDHFDLFELDTEEEIGLNHELIKKGNLLFSKYELFRYGNYEDFMKKLDKFIEIKLGKILDEIEDLEKSETEETDDEDSNVILEEFDNEDIEQTRSKILRDIEDFEDSETEETEYKDYEVTLEEFYNEDIEQEPEQFYENERREGKEK
jgi:hypothetical protein